MYFPLKYRLQTDSVRLFTECLPHKQMLFTATRLHVNIDISLNSTCLIWRSRTDLDVAFHSVLHRKCVKDDEFRLQNYFIALKTEQQFVPCNPRAVFLSNPSLHKVSTYKTRWIHSKLFVQTGVVILSTRAKFCRISVTKMRGKNRLLYFWSTGTLTVAFLEIFKLKI